MIRVYIYSFLIFFFAGCSVPTKQWPGENRSYLWTAMVAAAKTPDYSSDDPRKRWVVIENDVDVNTKLSRIIVKRTLSRSLKLPLQVEQIDNRDWIFIITLLPKTMPTIAFDVPEAQLIPVRSLDEAERYFSQVDAILNLPE